MQGHREEIYKVEVSPTLISNFTEAVMEEVKSWQSRALDSVYPIVSLDALVVKIREASQVRNKAICVVIGVNMQGNKEVLGLWAGPDGNNAEGAKFWLQAHGTEESRRGGYLSGLRRWAEGIPGWGVSYDPPDVAPELGTPDPIFRLAGDIRKVIYTTNAVESLNMSLRKVIKTRGSFPNQEDGVIHSRKKKSEEEHSGMGLCPKPEIWRFRARIPGPAPESALGLHLRRALPSAQVRPVYQG
jgi:transposase-like protein